MACPSRGLCILIGVVALALAGTAWADGGQPEVSGTTSSDVTSSSATLKGTVLPHGGSTSFVFEYGTTAGYGALTAEGPVSSQGSASPVSAAVTGLAASTTYHFRLVARSDGGVTYGTDRTFTTLAGSGDGGGEPGTTTPGTPTSGETQPTLGSTVLAAPSKGTVRVRRPGSGEFVALEFGSALPVGTEVDARDGTLALTSALPSGATQTGHFGGGRFLIRQGKRAFLDLYLRGRFCAAASTASAAATAAGSGGRRLWGRDHGGRFRTHGRNSHATVRGTRWLVADTCKGTLTRVTEGSVVVTDRVRHKRVVLEAGERYLAKPRR